MKQVRETCDASAYVVLNKKGEQVAQIHWRFGASGGVQCDVWSREPGNKCLSLTHQKKSSGYGYDKKTAALSGAIIEGLKMADHCGRCEPAGEKKREALMRAYIRAAASGQTREQLRTFEENAKKMGFRFANYFRADDMPTEPGANPGEVLHGYRYGSLHVLSGLERLESLGYQVIYVL